MAEIKVTNMAKFHTLCLLREGPIHGYEIIKEVGKKIGKNISPGQIYPFLSKLERNKIIQISEKSNRERKKYILTKKGQEFTNRLLNQFADIVNAAIEKKLKKCAHCNCEVYSGGFRCKGKDYCCKSCSIIKSR